MIPDEIIRMKNILDSFLGEPRQELTESYQLEYPCPKCVEKYGNGEVRKYNCSISLSLQKFNCWKCSDEGEKMSGSILKLIKLYGNDQLLKDYKEAVRSFRESDMYKLNFSDDDFNIDTKSVEIDDLRLPKEYRQLQRDKYVPKPVIEYLSKRGIGWDIIEKYNIGYTMFVKDSFIPSYRVYIPSYDKYGDLNYWTGRDYLNRENIVKYYNPKVERKSIIFNEEKLQWDADITLVEGPFDHIVVPNSVPLLGKVLNKEFKLYWEIINHAEANKDVKVNVFLDSDAYDSAKAIYKELNHGSLYGRVRYIPVAADLDPSKIYELYGYKGIVECLRAARKIDETELI